MSILDKPLTSDLPRRRRRWGLIILALLVVILLIFIIVTGPATDAAFVQHFFSAPQHFTYNGHKDYVSAVSWSPDGKRIASGGDDMLVQVWDALNGQHAYTYRGHADTYPGHFTSGAVNTVAWSPDSSHVASGSNDNTVQVWKAPAD